MTCGIYLLKFDGTDKVYIGQSIDIEDRFLKHKSAFTRNKSSPKLQAAYERYGLPKLEILVECRIDELNIVEKEAIQIFNSVNAGYNTLEEAGNPVLFGEKVGTARYTNEQYYLVLKLLIQKTPTLTKRQIEQITGISIYTIKHIAALESHCWLSEVYSDEYAELVRLKKEIPYYNGKNYPNIVSPNGIIYKVTHVTNFAKEHNLLQPKLSEVLNGSRKQHKGWKLEA